MHNKEQTIKIQKDRISILNSVAVSTLLIECFEDMISKKLVVQKEKQSVNQTLKVLESYVNRIFAKGKNEEENQELLHGATVAADKAQRLQAILHETGNVIYRDKKEVLRLILKEYKIESFIIEEIVVSIDNVKLLS